MRVVAATVLANDAIASETRLLRLHEPYIAATARPGQFLHVRCAPVVGGVALSNDPLLRRPLSVMHVDRQSGECTLLVAIVGRGTSWLAGLPPGQAVDVLGPLGRPFEVHPRTRRALMIAGGIGVAPVAALAEELVARELEVTLVAGYRDAAHVLPAEHVSPEVEYVIATNDGSAGRTGTATRVAAEYLAWADEVFACGPLPMLRALARMDRPSRLRVQVSMEEHMGCAMGVCLGCVVRTRKGYQRVCRDGPVFDIAEIEWQESD